ncbi:NAD(P)-dependent oxidoreductase [Pseudolysinimonas sp.]|uniref:NAD(P)-dependent oxidoreductase n=1 Tax=Pseudolysinimonas sp. TaxID=2680009 RepID=UPI003F7F26A9
MTVGFLGLGSMGSGMASRLVQGGHDVIVWNRSDGAVAELVARGARAATTPREALAADVSFSMLANDEATGQVLADESLADAAGTTHVSMASISPELTTDLADRFAEAGASFAAAPVLGRPPVAAAGELNILFAGPRDVLETARPYLELMGKRVWDLGVTPSQANVVKISVNYNLIHAMQAIGESVAMVERQGVDPGVFVDLLTSSLFGGVAYTGYGREIVERGYKPAGFTMELGFKDLRLAEGVQRDGGVTAATMPALIAVFEAALADADLRDADWGGIAEVSRRDLLG